jgi:hypothetical protein
MGATTEVSTILDRSPLAGRLAQSDAESLSVELSDVGQYLAMLVDELRHLHEAMLVLAGRVDEAIQ